MGIDSSRYSGIPFSLQEGNERFSTPAENRGVSSQVNNKVVSQLNTVKGEIKENSKRLYLGDSAVNSVAIKCFQNKPNFFQNINHRINYVKVNVSNGKEILININSLTKNMGLTKKEIKQAAKEGKLEEKINNKIDDMTESQPMETIPIDDQWEDQSELNTVKKDQSETFMEMIFINDHGKDPSEVNTVEKDQSEKIIEKKDPEEQFKIIKEKYIKNKWRFNKKAQNLVRTALKTELVEGKAIIEVNSKKYTVYEDHIKSGKIHIVQTNLKKLDKLGEGHFGTVLKVKDFGVAKEKALKTLLSKDSNSFKANNELKKASEHEGKMSLGIQTGFDQLIEEEQSMAVKEKLQQLKKNFLVFNFVKPLNSESSSMGMMGKLYQSDACKLIGKFEKKHMDKLKDTILALHFLGEMGIGHGDIKADNFLINDKRDLVYGDLGTAQFFTSPTLARTGMCTPFCAIHQEIDDLGALIESNLQDKPIFAELYRARDLFALGTTIYELIVGKRPYNEDEDDHRFAIPSDSEIGIKIEKENITQELKDHGFEDPIFMNVVVGMLDINPSERLKAVEKYVSQALA